MERARGTTRDDAEDCFCLHKQRRKFGMIEIPLTNLKAEVARACFVEGKYVETIFSRYKNLE